MRFWVFEGDFPIFGCQQPLNRTYSHRAGKAVPRVYCNATAKKDLTGSVRCEPGYDVEVQSLVRTGTG